MTHIPVREWGTVAVGTGEKSFTRAQANALIAAAKAHPLAETEAGNILTDHHTYLRARQMVGVVSAAGCSLEILPKVDPDTPDEDTPTVRRRLVRMLDVAYGLEIGAGAVAAMAQQDESLLDILIRLFADRLLAETRRGLPRLYQTHEEDLPALRGRLDVTRQFTVNAVRPDRLACRYDVLSHDIALLQAMKAAVVSSRKHARHAETARRLDELRFVLADVTDVRPSAIPWSRIRIDRSSRRWEALLRLARLLLGREWQATHADPRRDEGTALLFAMNDLFEAYVAALLKRAMANVDGSLTVDAQGGRLFCLQDDLDSGRGGLFQTRPDIIVRTRNGPPLLVLDTKWKRLDTGLGDRKCGVSQGDVYQLMAYGQLYHCADLLLLYPHHAALGAEPFCRSFTVRESGGRRLHVASVDVSKSEEEVIEELCLLWWGRGGYRNDDQYNAVGTAVASGG